MRPIIAYLKSVLAAVAAIVAVLFAAPALASGKLTIKPQYNLETDEVKWALGMPIYERITPNLAWMSWVGYGLMPDPDKDWLKIDEGLEAYYGALGVGIGGSWQYTPASDREVRTIYSTLSVTLW